MPKSMFENFPKSEEGEKEDEISKKMVNQTLKEMEIENEIETPLKAAETLQKALEKYPREKPEISKNDYHLIKAAEIFLEKISEIPSEKIGESEKADLSEFAKKILKKIGRLPEQKWSKQAGLDKVA